ncbi:MAG: M23 family metallopeptidase [Treponema sp.]|nr:M23 family metallopeptidase [Treponema sp.]
MKIKLPPFLAETIDTVSMVISRLTDQLYRSPPKCRMAFSLACILSMAYLFPLQSFMSSAKAESLPPEDLENGMGGAGYSENEVFIENAVLTGIPEPEDFSRPKMLIYDSYTVQKGEMIGILAQGFGLNQDTLLSVNKIRSARTVQIGQVIKVPNQDGILYTVKKEDTLSGIAEKYKTKTADLRTVNELLSDSVHTGTVLFIPGARMPQDDIQEINGDLFIWPVRGYITSNYGYRQSPFGGARQFHSGLDIGASMGYPVVAAMSGRVSVVSYDQSFGNFIVITHHSGYRTLYAHLSVVRVKTGAYVATGERIGDVGSSGLSTGPHLHFTVYKNGVTVNPRNLMQ